MKATAWFQKDAEILRVAVCCAKHPEQHLRLKEDAPIFIATHRHVEQLDDAVNAWTAVRFVFQERRQTGGLTHVFLRKSNDRRAVGAVPPLSVKALDGQHFHVLELPRFAMGHGQAELSQNERAKPFVLDGVPHVEL